jgi:hypothetical protein
MQEKKMAGRKQWGQQQHFSGGIREFACSRKQRIHVHIISQEFK